MAAQPASPPDARARCRDRRSSGPWTALIAAALAGIVLAGCTNRPSALVLNDRGTEAFQSGQYEEARSDFERVVEAWPGDWYAQFMLGRTLLALDQPVPARRALEVAATIRPDDEDVVDALAEALYRVGERNELFALLRERAEQTRTPRAYLRWADYAERLDDPDSAHLAVRMAIELDDGETVEPYLAAVRLAEGPLNDPKLAERRVRQAYWIDPNDPAVLAAVRRMELIEGPTLGLPPGR